MSEHLQPFLHAQEVIITAPTQCWFAHDGTMEDAAIQGLYVSDVRVLTGVHYRVAGVSGEHIGTTREGAAHSRIDHLHRRIDGPGADPGVSSRLLRSARRDGLDDRYTLTSRLPEPIVTTIAVRLVPDASPMDGVKAGLSTDHELGLAVTGTTATWAHGGISARLTAPGATIAVIPGGVELVWSVTIPARGSVTVGWAATAVDARAVVLGVDDGAEWADVSLSADDLRLERWVTAALDDLAALRLTTTHAPGEQFLAAGAPWFFTLFGRDSIWAARMLLPLGTRIAASTLRALADLQGSRLDPAIAEAPGKIMHELRRGELTLPAEGVVIPPLYYGSHDSTLLWICLLHDAWTWGMPEAEVEALLPQLERALAWMRDFGDADGDGLLEYIDETKRGLANQGWKDSGDSIQFADGTLAQGPIALVEVQAYAYEAAMHGAALLEHFGRPGADDWRAWAATLRERFHASFWLEDAAGPYLAIALDANKRPVDAIASNAGHVLGTGLLSPAQARVVGARLTGEDLASGFGLRTMSTTAAGYWPLSYHGGSVWAHDTAIAVAGLTREGLLAQADVLIAGLLAAAEGFDYRMPELHSGEPATEIRRPLPYPASCRPQAWSATAAVAALASLLRLEPGDGELGIDPRGTFGALRVTGLRLAGEEIGVTTGSAGEVVATTGGPVAVG